MEQQPPQDHEPEDDDFTIYGLLLINHAYNEGKINTEQWMELSRQWAERMLKRYGEGDTESPEQ